MVKSPLSFHFPPLASLSPPKVLCAADNGRTRIRASEMSVIGTLYAACRCRSESNGYRQHCGRVAAQYRLAAPKVNLQNQRSKVGVEKTLPLCGQTTM